MSIFRCQHCDAMADADDGCEEYGKLGMICSDCTDELEAIREEELTNA